MAGQQAGGGGGDDKNSMAILWIIFGIFMVGAIIWWAFAEELKKAFIYLRIAELTVINMVIKILPFLKQANIEIQQNLDVMHAVNHYSLNIPIAEKVSETVGSYLRWPIIFILSFLAVFSYKKNIKMRYKKRYDMEKLALQECSEWPQINPVLGEDLVATDLDQGAWAMAMPPMLFCKHYKLLSISVEKNKSALSKQSMFKAHLDQTKAESLFARQLGRMWHGPKSMPIHRRAIFAAFIARGCRDSQAARDLITQMNRTCVGGDLSKIDFSGADELWNKHYNNKDVQEIIATHAYEFTVFTALFLFARQDGVFPCSDFLWLKPMDRRFWYVLSNVGRQTPFCEAAGVHAHFLAEKSLKRKLNSPVIKEAVIGLQIAINELIFIPTPEEKEQLLEQANEMKG